MYLVVCWGHKGRHSSLSCLSLNMHRLRLQQRLCPVQSHNQLGSALLFLCSNDKQPHFSYCCFAYNGHGCCTAHIKQACCHNLSKYPVFSDHMYLSSKDTRIIVAALYCSATLTSLSKATFCRNLLEILITVALMLPEYAPACYSRQYSRQREV